MSAAGWMTEQRTCLHGVLFATEPRPIDPCPKCEKPVARIVLNDGASSVAEPCGHPVAVMVWPEQIELGIEGIDEGWEKTKSWDGVRWVTGRA